MLPLIFPLALNERMDKKRLIHSLRSSTGQLLKEPAEIRKCAVGFNKKLFKKEFQENPEVAQSFYRDLPKASEKAMADLNIKISAEELYSAYRWTSC